MKRNKVLYIEYPGTALLTVCLYYVGTCTERAVKPKYLTAYTDHMTCETASGIHALTITSWRFHVL